MKRQAEAALRGSIKKWANIVEGVGEDKGTYNCPLCHEFFRRECSGCPVHDYTGKPSCQDTPYPRWMDILFKENTELTGDDYYAGPQVVIGPKSLKAAIVEHDFLVSLLPLGGK